MRTRNANYIFIVKPELSDTEAKKYTNKENSRPAEMECLDSDECDESKIGRAHV